MKVKSPKGNFFLGHLRDFLIDPIVMMQRSVKECGYRTKLRFINRNFYILTHPDDVAQVLVKKSNSFHKGPGSRKLSLVFGNGLLTSDGEDWKKNSKFIRPFFSGKGMDRLIPEMRKVISESCSNISNDKINIHNKINKLTLDLISYSLFSNSFGNTSEEFLDSVTKLMTYVVYRLRQPLSIPLWIPIKRNRDFKKRRARLVAQVNELISSRKDSGQMNGDILQALIDARDEYGNRFNDKQLLDELITLLFAGHETIGSTVTFTLILLAQNSNWMTMLQAEADEIWSDETANLVRSYPLTTACIEESMRIWPSAWSVSRTAICDVEWDGLKIKKGEIVNLLPLETHRDKNFWEDPMTFNPNRFLGEAKSKHRMGSYFPFGAGPRLCVGRGMALMEGILIISFMIKNYTWVICDETNQEIDLGITLRPTTNVYMSFQRRPN